MLVALVLLVSMMEQEGDEELSIYLMDIDLRHIMQKEYFSQ